MMRARLVLPLTALLLAATAAAQEPEVGQLLIANASLDDPNFTETILLIVHHGADGSIALALNRPTWIEPAAAYPETAALSDYQGGLFFGGPVQPAQPLLVFERGAREPGNSQRVLGSIYVSADLAVLDGMNTDGENPQRIRLFAGHAAWAPGELADEIAGGTWRLAPAASEQIFTDDPAELWQNLPLPSGPVTAAVF
jgi:putative transcriptional regulator